MADIDLQEGVLRVRGKGRKDRLTPIGQPGDRSGAAILRNADDGTQLHPRPPAAVFLNKHGESLSTRSVRRKKTSRTR